MKKKFGRIRMSSLAHGKISLSITEVTHISKHGIWLLTSKGKEHFLPYEDFPWFSDQPVKVIYNVEELSDGHFYWPDIDVDLTEKMIENSQKYPLVAKNCK